MRTYSTIHDRLSAAQMTAAAALLLLLCFAAATSCDIERQEERREIAFRAGFDWGAAENSGSETKGMPRLDIASLEDKHFGVFAVNTGSSGFSDRTVFTEYHLYNHEFGDFSESSTLFWGGIPTAFWPSESSEQLTFFAYAPYQTNLNGQLKVLPAYAAAPEGPMKLEYTPSATNIANQLDLCVNDASITLNRTSGDNAARNMKFVHTLTQVQFFARYSGSFPDGYTGKVDMLKLNGVIGSKVLTYDLTAGDGTAFSWANHDGSGDDPADAGTEYTLYRSDGYYQHLTEETLKPADESADDGGYLPLQLINGAMYLLPQTIYEDKVFLEILYSYNEGERSVAEFSETIALPVGEWKAGKVINYKITLDVGTSSEITIVGEDGGMITDWAASGNDGGSNNTIG